MSSVWATRKRITAVCAQCGESFRVVEALFKRTRQKFCSPRCYADSRRQYDTDLVLARLREGFSYKKIRAEFRLNNTTLSRLAKSIGRNRLIGEHYDWDAVQLAHDDGASVPTLAKTFGIKRSAIYAAMQRGRLKRNPKARTPGVRNQRMTAAESMARHHGRRTGRDTIRTRIIEEGLLPYQCAICGANEWMGAPLTLRLDHKDGDGRNNKLENFRFLCPNCDSQQPTYGHRNRGRYDQPMAEMVQRQNVPL